MIRTEYEKIKTIISSLDKKVVAVLLSVTILQTISWYYTSTKYFGQNFQTYFENSPNVNLYRFLYWFSSDTIVLLLIPVLIIIFLIKEKPSNYGLKAGEFKLGIKAAIIFSVFVLIINWYVSSLAEFDDTYPLLEDMLYSWRIFIYYEAALLVYLIAWEFIWRGFLQFGLEEKFGIYAILVQTLPFVILHNGKPPLETFAAIIGGIILGYLAYRTRSIFYGVLIHFVMLFSLDLLVVLRYQHNDYNLGFNSLLNLFSKL
ncbi:CAAX amino terminal protease self- immunity [bacterium BMS3Abin04]|nr:CAAX amino terminal protease self- immunity [bacterium BMS3Abin04]